ncbi:olfactory receptor 52B2-like [Acanthochromis polyacanthus]|uniref:olfactory receptor 52B2-like n=1 Tax=Acanthochromis polyacanthus TaxID=80966 RepID=UPI002233F2D0|nr:olfactory receptor 52B2-like [Acanthochromis polyacanthus]
MDGNSSSRNLLTLETLNLSTTHTYPAFIFGTITYLFIVFCNLLILITIAVRKRLHKPMFILLFNLPISDMIGATAFFPQVLLSIVTQNRVISFPACFTQAFLIHLYGTGNLLILSAMAYDRYVAICCPLRYNAIMTPHTLIRIVILVWVLSFSFIIIVIILTARLKACRTSIVDLYCNNPSLLKLICEDITVNNYYGFAVTFVIHAGSLSILMYTYGQILRTCIMTNQRDARQKAMQTCGTHLVVFLILQISTDFTLIAHRLDSVSPLLRRACGVSILIFPPVLDPIIYGLKVKELKQSMLMFIKRNVNAMK